MTPCQHDECTRSPFMSASFQGHVWVLAEAYYDLVRRMNRVEALLGLKPDGSSIDDETRPAPLGD